MAFEIHADPHYYRGGPPAPLTLRTGRILRLDSYDEAATLIRLLTTRHDPRQLYPLDHNQYAMPTYDAVFVPGAPATCSLYTAAMDRDLAYDTNGPVSRGDFDAWLEAELDRLVETHPLPDDGLGDLLRYDPAIDGAKARWI